MPASLLRRALAVTVGCTLVGSLLAGCSAPDALSGAATATLTSSISGGGDSTSKPASSRVVALASLRGSSFAKRAAQAGGRVLKIGRGTLLLRNFTDDDGRYEGALLGGTTDGLVGAGISRSTVRLVTRSSTRRGLIPKAFPATNPLYVLRATGSATVLRGFTLLATRQGHLYNGLMVERTKRLRADHVRVLGVPGDEHQPPGETFAINDYRTTGSQWSHIRIDGKGAGATGFGVNSSKRIRICDAVSKNNPSGMGFAFWESSSITCVDCRAYDNGFSGFNFERTTGTVTLVRPAASGNEYDMRIASDQHSAKFRIQDPVLRDGVWTVWMPRTWYVKNKQKRSDITLTIHGRTRNDLLRIRTY